MPQELISLTKWPSMPAPFNSIDPGEAWVWGDYVAILQTKPILVAEMMAMLEGKKSNRESPLKYPFAMTVFYRKDRNPHGPSSRPVLVATLESMDYAAAAKMVSTKGIDISSMGLSGDAPVVQGLFTAESRANLGNFQGEMNRDTARRYFLDLIRRHLSLAGEPERIGVIADIYGHPKTGWPAQEKKKAKGCFSVIAALVVIVTYLVLWG